MMTRTLILAAAVVVAEADRYVTWIDLGCPQASASQTCSYLNPSSNQDMAVTLFFQVEDEQNTASFECKTGEMVQCSRSWTVAEQGSAGTCFFLLGADESFECSGSGQVNVIGSHGVHLSSQVLDTTTEELPCVGSLSQCSYTNSGNSDQWVALAFSAPSSAEHGLTCSLDDTEVCHYDIKGANDVSSCAFLMPKGSSMQCKSVVGSPSVTSAVARNLAKQLAPFGTPEESTCPPAGADPTLCDCSYTNPSATDMIVAISASNGDDAFNSFHCWIGNANTCAWGVNNGQLGAAGQCYFILPAGASYDCSMQFGATAFPSVTVLPLSGSIFPSQNELPQPVYPLGAPHIPDSRSKEDMLSLFAEFQEKHGPVEQHRFQNFKEFVSRVDNHPSNPPLVSGHNLSHLAVLSIDEFEATHRNCAKVTAGVAPKFLLSDEDVLNTPSTMDWRDHGAVTPVKDQGQCGSCWAFSTTGVLEGAWAAAGHGLTSLSEQQLVSCDTQDGNEGCGGGWPYLAVDYVHTNGIDTEVSYPYSSASGTAPGCSASSGTLADIQVVEHTVVESDEDAMAAWVSKNGPLSVSIDAMTTLFWPYTGGIMTGCCNTDVDHAVLVVGFGEEDGKKYWLIKNSWGESWGEQGYVRLERGTNQCGITYQPVGAIVSGSPTPTPTPTPPTPTPTPPTPTPTPPAGACPVDAQVEGQECVWESGVGGFVMPPSPQEYCDYISQGYFGYTWQLSDGDFNCAASARKSNNGDSGFCVWEDGNLGVTIPAGTVADCDSLSQGRVGMILPSLHTILI